MTEFDAYYYSFEPTKCSPVNEILKAVARAGKMYHNTSDWQGDPNGTFPTPDAVQMMQDAADEAASEYDTLKAKADMHDELVVSLRMSLDYIATMVDLQHRTIDTMKELLPNSFHPPKWTEPDIDDIKAILARAKELK